MNQPINFASLGRATHVNSILAQLSANNARVGHLLPLLLHCNNPQLPGYAPHQTSGGIFNYQPCAITTALAKQIFNYDFDDHGDPCIIDGLYTIGSLGSLGQSPKSDWDVWVCLNDTLAPRSRDAFLLKCANIERWAAQLGVELHLFLVNEDQFRQGVKSGFDKESSGSAQHWLLLDEFYRSAITLAGKPIHWHHISDQPQLPMLNLGEPPGIPAQEYFGAMLWQLYKGIDSPEKSLLKALLLESYFNDLPNTVLLSQEWREQLDHAKFIDHYTLLLNRITRHLDALNDHTRLELVRECFYLKCAPNLSYFNDNHDLSYQQSQLKVLTTEWLFSDEKIAHLDRQSRWKPIDRQQHHQALVSALLQSYQLMKKMAQFHRVDEALYPEEMAILSRKLYSAYQGSETKISRLTFKQQTKQSTDYFYLRRGLDEQAQRTWLLLNQAPVFNKDCTIYRDNQIIKLLGWVVINQLISSHTKILLPADIDDSKVNYALRHINQHFSHQRPATKNALIQANQIEQVLILINMQHDATINFHGQTQIMDWFISNIYSIGREKHSLVSSIELVYRNSWQEHHAMSFSGDNAILEMLCHLMTVIRSSDTAPKVKVYSLSERHQPLLRDSVLFTVRECLAIIKKSSKNGIQVKSLVVAGKLYGLFFQPKKVEFKEIGNAVELYQKLSTSALTQLPNSQPTTSKTKRIIYEHGSIGYVQFFLERKKRGIKVYILDEHNNLSSYWQDELDEGQLVKEIYRFYTFTKEQQNVSLEKLNISFNLPQFNKITRNNGVIIIEPLDRQAEELF